MQKKRFSHNEAQIRVAETKALISCAVTAQLICVFVFAYAKNLHMREKDLGEAILIHIQNIRFYGEISPQPMGQF